MEIPQGLLYLEEDEDLRIAVLDDNPGIGEVLQKGLEMDGHCVDAYFNPSKFLATFMESTTASTPFDLLIVDLFLSEGISGVEVIQQVWNAFPNLLVILISASSLWQIEPARSEGATKTFQLVSPSGNGERTFNLNASHSVWQKSVVGAFPATGFWDAG